MSILFRLATDSATVCKTNFRRLTHRAFYIERSVFIYAHTMTHSRVARFFLVFLMAHVLLAAAFDVEECPSECHCTMDGLLMLVDCSGLALVELPKFPDNQVS